MAYCGLLPPLLERLCTQTDEAPDFDREALAESVRQELMRLLNTRRPQRVAGQPLTLLDYGIADWAALQALRTEDRRLLLREVRSAVQHFEPRLQLSEIEVDALPGQPQRLNIRLSGRLRDGQRTWPASFLLAPGDEGMEVSHERLD